MSTPETASVLQEPQRSGAGERPKAHPSSAVLIASPGAGLRTRIRESLEGVCATHEVAQWETLDRTISSVLPSVVLFDMDLLIASGITDLSIIRRISRKTRIIVMSDTPSDEEGLAGLRSGARGYCARGLEPSLLRKAVEKVREGEIWAERRLIPLLVERFAREPQDQPERRSHSDSRLDLLTPREREIARMVGSGATNRDIAEGLRVGEGTVKAHLTAIFRKLGFTDRLQLGLYLAAPQRTRGRS
ncbi:MAG TPA: response regulator transcription factor [Thermoanaerobaculia bacterium]|nr:response regulator transcription factor [Thermoanaerobaculia bacterium]